MMGPKHVEQNISPIKNSVASSWFSSLHLNQLSLTNAVSQTWIINDLLQVKLLINSSALGCGCFMQDVN